MHTLLGRWNVYSQYRSEQYLSLKELQKCGSGQLEKLGAKETTLFLLNSNSNWPQNMGDFATKTSREKRANSMAYHRQASLFFAFLAHHLPFLSPFKHLSPLSIREKDHGKDWPPWQLGCKELTESTIDWNVDFLSTLSFCSWRAQLSKQIACDRILINHQLPSVSLSLFTHSMSDCVKGRRLKVIAALNCVQQVAGGLD